jgi:hypothetical protein
MDEAPRPRIPLRSIQATCYVASVGFVHNEAGRESLLRNLSIAEYRAKKEKHAEERDA